MNSKLLSKLSKSEILFLHGLNKYNFRNMKELKIVLKNSIKEIPIDFRGVCINDYDNRFNQIKTDDDQLFKR